MTPITITKPEHLDALVAEQVMGWIHIENGEYKDSSGAWRDAFEIPKYSSNISAAWLVVENLRDLEKNPSITAIEHGWNCNYISGFTPDGDALYSDHPEDTAPLAICLCALASVGIEVELKLKI